MHEMSLAYEIRSICERELAKLPETRLTALGVEVGAFSGVEVETLQFCLEVLLSDRFDGVRVDVSRKGGTAKCAGCGHEFEVARAPFECPKCGMLAQGISGGESLQVTYIEVE